MPITLASSSSIPQGLALTIVGMAVVFVSLTIIAIIVSTIRKALDKDQPNPTSTPANSPTPQPATPAASPTNTSAPQPAPPPTTSPAIPPHHIAVIAAAVAATTHRPHRLRRIVLLGRTSDDPWVAGGRLTLLASHRPSRTRRIS